MNIKLEISKSATIYILCIVPLREMHEMKCKNDVEIPQTQPECKKEITGCDF